MNNKTRTIKVGKKKIGGNNPILIQSMCNTKTTDINATINQINQLEKEGCEIIRIAIPNSDCVKSIKQIKDNINIPLVGDIHFNYNLAIDSLKYCDKIRINPGNIKNETQLKQIIKTAKDYNKPIRIGVNLGSIDKNIEKEYGRTSNGLVKSAEKYVNFFENNDFENIIISLKASDIKTTIDANILFRKKSDYPLHIGITEAGTRFHGTIKSSVGIGFLLNNGIGETIRVSLTDNPIQEIKVAKSILQSLNLRKFSQTIISCPTCSRTHDNLIKITKDLEYEINNVKKINQKQKFKTIAVMGCEVNGPGEAKNADIGVALGKEKSIFFKKGKIVKLIKNSQIKETLLNEITK